MDSVKKRKALVPLFLIAFIAIAFGYGVLVQNKDIVLNNSAIYSISGDLNLWDNVQVDGYLQASGKLIAGGDVVALGDVNGARFTDIDDANYYVDPAETSELNVVYATAYYYSSDIALKEDIRDYNPPLAKVLDLRPVKYKLKGKNTESIGFIAQEVEEIFPELVSENKGVKHIDYAKLVVVLVSALKQQQREIERLRKRIEELEERRC